jgi:hypothetical protein
VDEPRSDGQPLRLDPDAASADPALPPFVARPAGAPVYHGFPLADESRTPDGWCFGVITDPDCPAGADWGDAFVVAPDDSRAGLIWHVGPAELEISLEPDASRWGVYAVGIPRLVHSQAELVGQLREWLPELRRRHAAWAARHAEPGAAVDPPAKPGGPLS